MSTSLGLGRIAVESTGNANYQLEVGSVLSRSIRIWFENLLPFLLVGMVVNSPVYLGLLALSAAGEPQPLLQRLLDLVSNLLTLVLTGAVTYGVFQSLRGKRAGVGEILRLGVSRFGAVWVTGFLSGLGMMLGFCAFIVPGLILMTHWWLAVPVAVIEESGSKDALQRSAELSSGNRWRIFALILILGVAIIGASAVVGFVVGMLGSASVTTEAGAILWTPWAQALMEILVLPLTALVAVAPAVAYHDLRVGKEGADIEELLRVFE